LAAANINSLQDERREAEECADGIKFFLLPGIQNATRIRGKFSPAQMNIIVWGINYAPELTGIAPYNRALCEHLHKAGHEVRMVTTFSYYPAWKKTAADRGKLYRTDVVNGVKVFRCWHYVPHRVTTLKRMVHEATFISTTLLRLLTLPRPDIYVVISPPLLLGLAARVLQMFRSTPYVFHVQDLQPDAAVGLGMLKPSAFTRLLYRLEALAYRRAVAVSGISHEMLDAFTRKGVPAARQIYFPNGVTLPAQNNLPSLGKFRARHGFKAEEFLAIYSGNLGVKQGLDILVEAAKQLGGTLVRIVICGDGAMRPKLEASIQKKRLQNILLLPLQPDKEYQEMLADADVCLITQQAGSGAAFLPSKLLAVLALARPVVGVADETSALRRAIAEGGFGKCVQPGDAKNLSQVLQALAANRTELDQYGSNGRQYVEQFAFGKVLPRFAADLKKLLKI
jgi:colanic acid biosynthesis glycosyl transferase WcaI